MPPCQSRTGNVRPRPLKGRSNATPHHGTQRQPLAAGQPRPDGTPPPHYCTAKGSRTALVKVARSPENQRPDRSVGRPPPPLFHLPIIPRSARMHACTRPIPNPSSPLRPLRARSDHPSRHGRTAWAVCRTRTPADRSAGAPAAVRTRRCRSRTRPRGMARAPPPAPARHQACVRARPCRRCGEAGSVDRPDPGRAWRE